ncbi:ribonuclease H-like domain-containing protein, partial [Tanacetum coccineum]
DNGTEFKNSIMNQFCEMKGIKREFSVDRTPRQNGVADRKNITLIEAARTMLKTSTDRFHETFWLPVTILNTKDHLGKFDGKADEGYFVGYSMEPKIIFTPVNTAGPSFDIAVPSTPVNVVGPSVSTANESEEQLFERFSPFKNAFTLPPVPNISSMDNTGIFGNAYDDKDVE